MTFQERRCSVCSSNSCHPIHSSFCSIWSSSLWIGKSNWCLMHNSTNSMYIPTTARLFLKMAAQTERIAITTITATVTHAIINTRVQFTPEHFPLTHAIPSQSSSVMHTCLEVQRAVQTVPPQSTSVSCASSRLL